MQYQSEVIVLQDADASGNDYAALLSAQGFTVQACCNVSAFARLHHDCDIQGVLVVGDAQPLGGVVGRIRTLSATMPVVVVRAGADVALRVQALHAGADACYAADVAAIELAAALQAARRRGVGSPSGCIPLRKHHPTAHDPMTGAPRSPDWTSVLHRRAVCENPRGWRLMDGGCTLVSPVDERLRLTASERVLMQQLIGRVGRPLHRDDLAEAGWPSHAGMGANKPRSVDVLISRLRRKAERQGMALPLMAVRRWGYMFLGDVAAPPMRGD